MYCCQTAAGNFRIAAGSPKGNFAENAKHSDDRPRMVDSSSSLHVVPRWSLEGYCLGRLRTRSSLGYVHVEGVDYEGRGFSK